VIAAFIVMRYNEVKGHWPLLKPTKTVSSENSDDGIFESEKGQERITERVYTPPASKEVS
jgi:hypothetical protein